MSMTQRLVLATGIVAVDLVVFFLPLTGFFMAYVLVFNPPWFRAFIHNLDRPDP